jgi:hypothetical protein
MSLTEKLIMKHTWLTRILCTMGFFRTDKEWLVWLEGQKN